MNFLKKNNLLLLTAALALLISHFAIFGRFFPNESGRLGNDYAYFLPILLDGYFWYHTNGFWEIPWFTPSFCGGWPNYVNVQSCFYTIPQIFTLFIDPLNAVRLTFVLFAGLGLLGFYLLLRRVFLVSRPVSLLGAGLFLFNGFYSHRMLSGHFGDHSFMLLPLISFGLLRPLPKEKKGRLWQLLFDSVMGGLLIAYMVQSGFGPYLIPVLITIVLIALIHGLLYGRQWQFWLRWTGTGITSVLLCASKLTGIYYLMSNFPRSTYKLPGAKSFLSATWLMLKSLFISPAFDANRLKMLTNIQWFIERHELEYSVTIVPLVIILFGLGSTFRRMLAQDLVWKLNWKQGLHACTIIALLMLPVAINTYSPGWNAFLKKLPIIKSASILIRWFIIPIPIVILIAALTLTKRVASSKYQVSIVVVSLATVVALNAFVDRDFYRRRNYDPEKIVKSYHEVKSGSWKPTIKQITVYVNPAGEAVMPIFRNDTLVHGKSQLLCYEALFGYRLEDFPIKKLRPGPALEEKEDILNIKNPACYVWPEANNCDPGDHFTKEQKDAAEAFVNYRPYPFKMPAGQQVANWVNVLALIFTLLFLFFCSVRVIYSYLKTESAMP